MHMWHRGRWDPTRPGGGDWMIGWGEMDRNMGGMWGWILVEFFVRKIENRIGDNTAGVGLSV